MMLVYCLHIPSIGISICSAGEDVTFDGITYTGMGEMLPIDPIEFTAQVRTAPLRVRFALMSQELKNRFLNEIGPKRIRVTILKRIG